jgi:hypothetical protein
VVANVLLKSHKAEQRKETYFEIKKHEALSHEARMIESLREAFDQYEELQYKLMCQTIEKTANTMKAFQKSALLNLKNTDMINLLKSMILSICIQLSKMNLRMS